MKVRVLESHHGHVTAGMTGEAFGLTPLTFEKMKPQAQVQVTFLLAPFGGTQKTEATVMMYRRQLEAA